MRVPTFLNTKFVEHQGESVGYLTPDMQNYNDELNQALQNNLNDDGFVIPSRPDTEVVAAFATKPVGTILFDVTNDVWVGKTSAGLVQFTTASYP